MGVCYSQKESEPTASRPKKALQKTKPQHTPAPPQTTVSANTTKTMAPTNIQERVKAVQKHFPKAFTLDDFMARAEVALAGYGFTGDNSIAFCNLCRDESCMLLEDKIESVFGSCFSTHGLGGVLTCGVVGIKAGLSHSPTVSGKDQYVFFSFPHIGIDSNGEVGKISRPNRPGPSSACGALSALLGVFKGDGLDAHCTPPGTIDPMEPELSILKSRLARRLRHEKKDAKELDLVSITQAAERTITSDLEYLIEKAVDTSKANYAVFTGTQIHNWAADVNADNGVPSMEFVSGGKCYVVVNGEKTYLDLSLVPSLAPRQLALLAGASNGGGGEKPCMCVGPAQEIPRSTLMQRLGGLSGSSAPAHSANWHQYVKTKEPADAHPGAPKMDDKV